MQPGRTKLLYTEIVANPAGTVADLEALADGRARRRRPAGGRLHARLARTCAARSTSAPTSSLHSATKYLGGHGTSIGGAIVDSGRFPWDNGNFPVMTEPVATYGNLRFWDNFGEYGFATKLRVEGLRNLGGVLSPFNAFLILQGMETLPLRMDAHVANAQAVAEWLDGGPARELGPLRRPARRPQPRARRRSTCRRARARCSPSAARRARGGRGVHRRASSCARTWPTSATRARSSSTPARPRTASSPRRRWRPPACCPSWCASASASRTSTTSSSTSIGRSDEPSEVETARGTWTPPGASSAARSCAGAKTIAVVGASANPARASHFVLTYLLSSSADYEVWPVTPTRPRSSALQSYPSLADLPGDARHRRRLPPRRPAARASREEAVDAGAGAFWMQLGLHSDEAVRDRARRPASTSSPTAA